MAKLGFWRRMANKASDIKSGQFLLDRMPRAASGVLTGKGVDVNPAYEAAAGSGGLAIFGDGSDGDITVNDDPFTSGTLIVDNALQRDAFFNNLTVNVTRKIETNGYRIFVKGILTNNGTIRNNGGDGGDGVGGGAGAAGTQAGSGSLGEGAAAGAGGAGVSGDGTNGNIGAGGSSITSSLGGEGNDGGNGGMAHHNVTTGDGGGGGTGGTVTEPVANRGGFRALPFVIILKEIETTVAKIKGGSGGAGGGSGGTIFGSSGGGGGGGASGGILLIVAKSIINTSGIISANGGKGGDAGQGTLGEEAWNAYGGSGGGGGGGGGLVVLVYNSLSSGTEEVGGGALGTHTNGESDGGATHADGTDGLAGAPGTVIKIANS